MSGTHGALRLMELSSSQLCQDFGDLLETLDRLPPGGTSDPENVALDKARKLKIRLQLRRAAWGAETGALSSENILALAPGLPNGVTVDLSAVGAGIVFPAPASRILLNLLLLAADSLPAGGVVVLAGTPDDLFIRIVGRSAAWPAGLAQCLANETEARSALTNPHNLQMALTSLLGQEAGIRLSLLIPPTSRTDAAILRMGQ